MAALIAAALVAAALLVAAWIWRGSGLGPDDTGVPASPSRVAPRVSQVAEASTAEPRSGSEAADAVAAVGRSRVAGARPRAFEVKVAGRDQVFGKALRVELLFAGRTGLGDRRDSVSLGLFVDQHGEASWTAGPEAVGPWFADFGFPTLGRCGVRIADGATAAKLTLPSTCVLEIAVVEVDGLPTSDSLTAEARAPNAPWPANRWRPVPFVRGRAALMAEAAGQEVEVRVSGASGRTASSRFVAAASDGHDERVPCVLALDAGGGVISTCQGLSANPSDGSCELLVCAFGRANFAPAGLSVHSWPDAADRYVFFPPREWPKARMSWLLTARVGADPERWSWGVRDAAGMVSMQPMQPVISGRVVDADGRGLRGYDVDLLLCSGAELRAGERPLVSTVSGEAGAFRMYGPDPDEVPMAIAVRQVRAAGMAPVQLPSANELVLRVAQ